MGRSEIVWEMAQSICRSIYSSDFGRYLWLISPSDLSTDQNIRRLDDGLRFLYKEEEMPIFTGAGRPGTILDEVWGRYFFNFLRKQLIMTDKPVLLQGGIKMMSEDEIHMELQLTRDEVYVPLRLTVVRLTDKRITAEPEEINDGLTVLKVSPEAVVAGYMCRILKDLELIGEMEPYLYLYEVLKRSSMDGKNLGIRLEDAFKGAGIYPAVDNRRIFDTYDKSTYMKKRWKKLLRRQKLTSPSWEEVHELIAGFIDPIMDTTEKGLVFFGDWMPNLGRFLD